MIEKHYSGLLGGGKAYFILENLPEKGVFVVITSEENTSIFADNLTALRQFFKEIPIYVFPAADQFCRISVLNSLSENPYGIVIATSESLMAKTISPGNLQSGIINLRPGIGYKFNSFMEKLTEFGYLRADFVEEKGQFSRRGEVLDIWPPDQIQPWRLVFYENTLESVRSFEVVTQRSSEFISSVKLIPAQEKNESFISAYFPEGTVIFMDSSENGFLPDDFKKYPWLINSLPVSMPAQNNEDFFSCPRYGGSFKLFSEDVKKYIEKEFNVIIYCSNEGEKERLEDILFENKLAEGYEMRVGPLVEGFFSTKRKLAVFSSQEVLYKRRQLSFPKLKSGRRLEGLWEISPRDYVVHEKYGIGRYLGLKKIIRGEQEAEYLCLEYKGGDKIYVPHDDFRVVQKYVGIEGCRPKLFSIDTFAWERAKKKAREGAQEMAEELLKLYAARKMLKGHSFQDDTHWEKELADSFPYQETEDQLKAIEDVKQSLMDPSPMERLICGDVGFGKTEVAIRAAFKVVQDSKQVAVLVPTTVLAEQHYNTFSNRLSPFPLKIAVLSRFQSKKEQLVVLKEIEAGTADIVIGTHRLLQKDIKFKDLGLLIVDEEHRFGVKQKEKIKSLKKNLDILLLSATPIPRTLSMAISNLRDLSVIETPPYGRLPIETHLGPFDEKLVKKIISAELSRGGQVFYVHNRVETILSRAAFLKRLIPEIKCGVIHGQMHASDIEKSMWEFLHGKINVLIATTIIESGLDIPSVNTMVIEEAENFGLAQLYQLRGRVGREKQKAYCYLFYTLSALKDDSMKRLEALREFGELGSGFRLALRDLEIRGAGNILSSSQHGFARDIGFELYSRLLDEAGKKLKGAGSQDENGKEESKATLDFSTPAFLPEDYIQADDLRIMFYRKLSGTKSDNDINDIKDEIIDRFGPLPLPAMNLFEISSIRLLAESSGIKQISEDESSFSIYFSSDIEFRPKKIVAYANTYADILEFMRGESRGIRVKKIGLTKPYFDFIKSLISKTKEYLEINFK